jgi:hypothetical protein
VWRLRRCWGSQNPVFGLDFSGLEILWRVFWGMQGSKARLLGKQREVAMSNQVQENFRKVAAGDAEATLRMIARLPAPEDLENRVFASLNAAPDSGRVDSGRRSTGRVLAWPVRDGWARAEWMRGAAAAAIVFLVAGGGYGIYSRVQPVQGVAGPRVGEFGGSGAVVRPKTLQGPAIVRPAVPAVSLAPKTKAAVKVSPKKSGTAVGAKTVASKGPVVSASQPAR